MASSVFYKFKSQRDESRITFDGTALSVFDLKKEIILANNLGKANDFDLYVYDSTGKQEYNDDHFMIPRSSSIIVSRRPAARPGKGKAAMYLAGSNSSASVPTSDINKGGSGGTWYRGAMSKRFDARDTSAAPTAKPTPPPMIPKSSVAKDDEAAAMAAMFQAQSANWEETQEKMSHATRIHNQRGTAFGSRGGKPHVPFERHQPERPLPPSYVCYRCGKKGHWIQDCPTNNDRDFDNKPRIKRTTGIPRSFLKAVDNPDSGDLKQGVMVTPEGGYVVAQPDVASWQKRVTRSKALTAADVRDRPPTDPSLACPIDNKLFKDAVKTPCCETSYCEECIQTHLLERDFMCPKCNKKIPSLDKVVMDKPTRTKVADYIDKKVEESRKEAEEDVGSNPAASDPNNSGGIYGDEDLYSDQQPNMDMQMIVDSIPQIQAQIQQLSVMMQNSSIPHHIRQSTEMKYQQLQMQLQHAQALAATLAVASTLQQQEQQQQQQQQVQQAQMQQQQGHMGNGYGGMQGGGQGQWGNPYANQAPPGQDSAYQRLPINNRRRNLKRDRPSDFLEVGGESESKVPRYWE